MTSRGNFSRKTMKPQSPFLVLCAVAAFFALSAFSFASASVDDTAKVLAGLPPSSGSSLEPLTVGDAYKGQASMFSEMWRRFEDRQLSRVRTWADRELPPVRAQSPVLYYTFSGPDIVYANTFFPDCKTYVMCGLEPVGDAPDLLAVPQGKLADGLRRLYGSLDTVLALGFFKTADMGSDFRNPELPGITPVIMTFLGRLGKTVKSVDLVAVDREGNESPRAAGNESGEGLTPGVKIVFDSGQGTPEQTVYYFSTNISNDGLGKNPGFANFCRKLEPGAGLVKAASYLMHSSPFSATRDFLMERCKFILQDDTGIPATVFAESKWQMRPYGRYVRPIEMFRGNYQKKLAEIHAAGDGVPLEFGVGYYYRVADCNMLLASRDADSIVVAELPQPEVAAETSPSPEPTPMVVAETETAPAPAEVVVVAANEAAAETKTPRQKLIQLEAEELRIRKDESLTKKERMQKLREIWKQQLEVMGKKAA